MRFEILELFVNTLTTNDKYSSRNIQNLTQQLETTMSQKQKTFYRIFITYVKSRTSSDDFVKKMSLLAEVFMILLMPKKVIT